MSCNYFENECTYNRFGYCKFRETCRYNHTKEICEMKDCEIERCPLRHPRDCRFFNQYARCKFGSYCFFRHKTIKTNEELELKIRSINSDFANLEKSVSDMKERIIEQDTEIKSLKCIYESKEKDDRSLVSAQCQEIQKNLIETCQTMITESAKAISIALTKNQVNYEEKNLRRLDMLHDQLSAVSSLLKPADKKKPNS